MRDPELIVDLLQEMDKTVDGQYLVEPGHLRTEEGRKVSHHIDLLCDAELAVRESRAVVRITNSGYDFLYAINQGSQYKEEFKKLMSRGKSLLEVVATIVSMVNLE